MNRDTFHRRTRAVLDPDLAREQVLLIIGLGSGGSRVAEEAARSGVGRLILIDRPQERLEEHNIARHVLGYSGLGRLKLDAMRERLADINPGCEVMICSLDVRLETDRLAELVGGCTQVNLCTDNEPSKHAVNQVAMAMGRPLVFAGVFDGGIGGEVGRCMPGSACYACMCTYLQRQASMDADPPQEHLDYGRLDDDEARSTAALNIDIAQIALIQARVGLLTMLESAGGARLLDGNYILFGNRPVPGLFPRMLHNEIWSIPAHPACAICSRGHATGNQLDAAADALRIDAEVRSLAQEV
jgi:molybdopterin/thiamine biosynthesis adenylyltransferase